MPLVRSLIVLKAFSFFTQNAKFYISVQTVHLFKDVYKAELKKFC